jgi:hypothetical protein
MTGAWPTLIYRCGTPDNFILIKVLARGGR